MTEPFTPPSMMHMPFANLADRRAAQEDAYIAWCDARDAAAHEAQAIYRADLNRDALDQAKVDRAVAMQPHAFGRRAA